MQLFVIDKDPCSAAHALADCHVRMQIPETAQILTAYWVNSGFERRFWMPRPQNLNHPVAKALNPENVGWVIEHFYGLLVQFRDRFGKEHKYSHMAWDFEFNISMADLGFGTAGINSFHRMFSGFTPKPGDIVSEYRQYYRWKSKHIKNFKYTGVKPPKWLGIQA